MPNISSNTKSIFGGIAALKTISEKSSTKNRDRVGGIVGEYNNVMSSLVEIFNQLGGYSELLETIENVLVKNLDNIEMSIKGTIKTAIKQTIACGVEPSVDDVLIQTGVTFSLGNVDPQSFLTIDPISENGNLIYFDNSAGLLSKDFNTFLYAVIVDGVESPTSTGHTWYDSNSQPLIDVSFREHNNISGESNLVTIKINNFYRGKKLSSFISDYLDSVKLFDNIQLLSSIFDDITGSKIFSLNKTTEQLSAEKLIEKLCDNMLNSVEETDVIDDSFYTFSNDVYNQILEESELKRTASFLYYGDETKKSSVDESVIISSLMGLKTSNNLTEQVKLVKTAIDNIVDDAVKNNDNINEKDKLALKMNFIRQIIFKLMTKITMTIFSPKIMFLFVMINKIYNVPESTNIVDFIKNNINIYKIIIIKIRDIITKELTSKILEMLSPMISKVMVILNAEKLTIYKKQIDDIRNLISSATKFVSVAQNSLDTGKNYI